MIKTVAAAGAIGLAALTAQAQEIQMTDTIYEIAIQEVKPGQEAAWSERRAAFLAELKDRQGNEQAHGSGRVARGLESNTRP